MGDPIPVSKGKGSNAARYAQAGQARHVNCYTEETGEEGKTVDIIVAINGWELVATLTNGAGLRKMLVVDSQLLAISGRLLFSTNIGFSPITTVGGIPSDGPVTMVHNRKTPNKQVAIVCDGLYFFYEAGTLTPGADPDLPPPIAVTEVDGYFVFIIEDGRWYLAGPNTSDIDALDLAEAEASADSNVTAVVRGRTLIILGEKSAEFWDPNGSGDFPFSRTTAIDVGCYAAKTVDKLLVVSKNAPAVETVMFCGTDHNGAYSGVMALNGYTAAKISTPEVDRLVRDEPDKSSLEAMAFIEDGIPRYVLSGSSFTKAYNAAKGEWFDLKSNGEDRWNASCYAQFGSLVLFGHRSLNKIYKSLPTALDEAGEPIICVIQPPPIGMWPQSMIVDQLWADFITGVGRNIGDDDTDDPELIVDYSKDGGENFAVQRRVKLGQQGQKQTRIKLRTMGKFDHNGLTLRFTVSADVIKGLQQLAIDARPVRS